MVVPVFVRVRSLALSLSHSTMVPTPTSQVLDHLANYGFKAAFFVCGDNGYGAIDTNSRWIDLIRRMDAKGHQVASHTWNHPDLSTITVEQRYDEMIETEMGIRNILGKYPIYMRPPHGSCNEAYQTVMKDHGYVIATWGLDTQDWDHQDDIQQAKEIFKREMDQSQGGPQPGHRIVLAHDFHEQTASSLTPYMFQYLKDNGWKGVTLCQCLGELAQNWYRPSQGTLPPSDCTTGGCSVSTDGLCGTQGGIQGGATCSNFAFGSCCSEWGYCGSTSAYCGTGCNKAFGTCT
jgi:peptidoglycan/xylan/chitin deacetylase (PgdA/CDA1 family)